MKLSHALLCIALLAGCTQSQVNSAGNQVNSAGAALASAAPVFANDALIVGQIEGAYVTIDPVSALHVAVASHGGMVRISGRVRSVATRDKFVEAAKKISQVKNVDVALTVDEKLPSAKNQVADFALAAAVQANVAGQAGINALSVHVAAHSGTVTLSGKVPSDALRSTIVEAAKKVAGVHDVVDTLNVGT
jgi:osmotically-inducible protein OsmY